MKALRFSALAFLFSASLFAGEKMKFAFLAPDPINPVNAAIYNGIKDAFKELENRYGKEFEVEYISANSDAENQARQLGGAYIDGFMGAVIYPAGDVPELRAKIAEAAENGFMCAAIGQDLPNSKRFCYVGGDPEKFVEILKSRIERLAGGKKLCASVYFKSSAPEEEIGFSDSKRISELLGSLMPYESFKKIAEPLSPKIVAVDYYSVYAAANSVEILRRDDFCEIFFSPYLFSDMAPVKPDGDRVFAICVGAVPQLEKYIASGQITACIYSDYYGWGYFAARALLEKTIDNSDPSVPVRLIPPLIATPATVDSFIADWRKWIK